MSIQADSWIMKEVELVVVGGGPAGVAAAETAARKGLSVLLIEKEGFLGGQAVGGLSATICGLYLTNEKWTHENGPVQIVYGFAERFRQKMIEKGGLTQPQLYGNTYVEYLHPDFYDGSLRKYLTTNEAPIVDGYLEKPTLPGLGIDINREFYKEVTGKDFDD